MRTLLVTLIICLFVLPAQAKYSGGTGDPNDPYQIATAADLIALGEEPNDYDKHFILTADIDLDPNLPGRKVFDRALIAPDMNDAEDGYQGTWFVGVFDGDGHTISNLTMIGTNYLGLFGQLDEGNAGTCEVNNLGLVHVVITGSGHSVGGLVGFNYGNINSSYSIGTINGRSYVGGLVGWNWNGSITTSYSNCSVSGVDCVGGLVGINGPLVGRLLGDKRDGAVTQCYSSGKVNGTRSVGGLVGVQAMFSVVNNSFWDIEASGKTTSDGGIGLTTIQMQSVDTFLEWGSCGNEAVWTIDEGKDYPRLSWENKSGRPIESKLSDFLAGEGTQASPYLVYTLQDINLISRFSCEQDKHFRLMFLAGEGTQENPYLISAADELHMLGRCPFNLDMHFRLMADISLLDFDGKEGRPAFRSIGTYGNGFAGIFDGNGHTISHLTIADGDYNTGLFSMLASGGEILDLGVVDVNIETSTYWHDYYGGLVGVNSGIVVSCYSTGSIAVDSYYVGGLVGYNSGIVVSCYSTGAVSGIVEIGGLVGRNIRGSVTDCYSTGTVNGNHSVGGLVGYNYDASISQSYSTGVVMCNGNDVGGLVGRGLEDRVTACFWDIQTSGQATSAGGIGKTTAEMQTAKTFLDVGWDFVDEIANGTDDIWWILEGQDYPRLWWELIPEN